MNIPASTYRIQLNKDFTFRQLEGIISYIEKLGISTIYAAPILRSKPGSMHGYDVIDPHILDPEIGKPEELKNIVAKLRAHKMLWLQDIVPNHMAFDVLNFRLMDVLERGPQSPYYNYFDINWNHASPRLKGKVMVPFLGDTLEACIERKEIKLSFSENGFGVNYFDTQYPLSVSVCEKLAAYGDDRLKNEVKKLIEKAKDTKEYYEWKDFKKQWMQSLSADSGLHTHVKSVCDEINNNKSKLTEILQSQYYLLEFWKTSEKEINYRRFFTVNELICLRMEDQAVFDDYHKFIQELYGQNLIQGVRIDHIDGLYDPSQYTKRLRKLLGNACYIIAEKILEAKEDMPDHWPLEGTSGYEFLSYVSQLITDRHGAGKLLDFYNRLISNPVSYKQLVYANKKLILEQYMAGEWENLIQYFCELGLQRDFDRQQLKEALSLIMLALPVYRIYPEKLPVSGKELSVINETFQKAFVGGDHVRKELEYFQSLFIDESSASTSALRFIKRLMQFTGPLTAKGVEDTTFYVYNPLISHDEVGDAPSMLGISMNAFHEKMIARQKSTPLSLNATATHDTKRGEDARLRVNILSEIPDTWERYVNQWFEMNAKFHDQGNDVISPSKNDEYFIYQAMVGGFPEDLKVTEEWIERVQAFLTKAIREAKVNSNWSDPNEAYESACLKFVEKILQPEHSFLTSFISFMEIVCRYAHLYALSQVLIKITAPGIPDVYQGCELWDLSFVDPDNRRPVDYDKRMEYLDQIIEKEQQGPQALFNFLKANRSKGVEKLFVTWKSLNFRKSHAELFANGEYIPLQVTGKETIIIAYARQYQQQWVLVIIPLGLARNREYEQPYASDPDDKRYVALPEQAPQQWRNLFSNEIITSAEGKLQIFDVFKDFPVALLTGF